MNLLLLFLSYLEEFNKLFFLDGFILYHSEHYLLFFIDEYY